MTQFATINFPCPDCGALFALTEKVAARKIQCPCGRVFIAPAMPEILADPEPYDVGAGQGASAAKFAIAVPSVKAISSRAPLYPHRSISSFSTDDSEAEFSLVRDRIIPIAMLAGGLALRIGEMPFDRTLGHGNYGEGFGILVFQMVLAAALMLTGVLITAKILGANFGPVGTAVLKLCAMAIFSFAVGAAIVIAMHYEVRAIVIAIHVVFIIHSVAFWKFFSLDLQEAILTAAVCTFLQNAAGLVVFMK